MKFSIITPTFNSSATLATAVESVLAQGGVDLEYILVDGASTDGTVELIRNHAAQDPRIRWISEPDDGIADAFNKGLAMAKGDWIGIVNSDDCYAPGALAAVAEEVSKHPDADVVYGDMLRLDEEGAPVFILKPAPLHTLWWRMSLNHPATFVSRAAYGRIGTFDPVLRIAMDHDLILRLYTTGARFVYLERVLSQMRYGGASDLRLVDGLLELKKVSIRHGYPRWKAEGWFWWRLAEGLVKRLLRRLGLQGLQTLHPRFRPPSRMQSKKTKPL